MGQNGYALKGILALLQGSDKGIVSNLVDQRGAGPHSERFSVVYRQG